MPVNLTQAPISEPVVGATATPAKIKRAAQDFEALLIGQMLKSVRESSTSGWGNSDQAGAAALDMADEQMAQLIASNGGLGLARLISSGLETKSNQNQNQNAENASNR